MLRNKLLTVNSVVSVALLLIISDRTVPTFADLSSYPQRRSTCAHEMEQANQTIASWALTMRQMIAQLPPSASNGSMIVQEEARIQDLIEKFSSQMNRKPIEQLVKNLVSIRRRSNRMSLEIYIKTLDMRWPQTSSQLGAAVERVQRACLPNPDRAAMLVLNSPFGAANKSPKG